jgi:secretion/DNA translocation related TadE-like protein
VSRSCDRGSATVLVLALCAVVVLAGSTAATLGAVAVARHRAAAAADLAALAAAARVAEGPAACAAADRVARSHGAGLVACRPAGWEVVVETSVRPPGVLGGLGAATARARAGPVSGARPVTGVTSGA